MNLHSYSRLPTDKPVDSQNPSESRQEGPQSVNLDEMISRYLDGTSVQILAAEAGKHRATIYRWMLSGLGDTDYHDLVTQCLVNRIEYADERLMTAVDGCDIARAREMARFARMDFERRRPALYGQKQEVTHISADLGDRLRRARERVIEGEHTSVMSNSAPKQINHLEPVDKAFPKTSEGPIQSKEPGPTG